MNIISKNTRLNAYIMWALALVFLTTGFYLSQHDIVDEFWLSRAGCLVAILGIWSSIGGLIHEKILLKQLSLRRQLLITNAWRKHWADEERLEDKVDTINERIRERQEKIEHGTELSIGILEASLLLTGTFVWGFGDLIIYIL